MFSEMIMAQVGIERVTALLDAPLGESDTPEVIEKYGDVFDPKRENWERCAAISNLKTYGLNTPTPTRMCLKEFNLQIPAGTTVAIVGETGAGKSTLVNLACRFYEPTIRASVLIDGRDYRERSLLWLHSSLGYVLQDPHLFSGTVMENIRYGRLDATDEDVVRAAGLVSADTVVAKLPEGVRHRGRRRRGPAVDRREAIDLVCPGDPGRPAHLCAGRGHLLHRYRDGAASYKTPSRTS